MIRAKNSRPDWETDGRNWPNRSASRFVNVHGLNWHIQEMGSGNPERILLIHGTGAATHSFRDMMHCLAEKLHVVCFDLPGHGFTTHRGPTDLSLNGMCNSVTSLLGAIGFKPDIMLGHSAGAAIAIECTLQGKLTPRHIFGVNAALRPIKGNALLSPMAKLLFANPLTSRIFSITSRRSSFGRNLIATAGPKIDKTGHDAYSMLMGYPDHVRGAMGMMASWNLETLDQRLPKLQCALTLIVSKDDKLVPPSDSEAAVRKTPGSKLIEMKDGGHLLHEIHSNDICRIVLDEAAQFRPGITLGGTG